jgi:hypothetical protein
MHTRSWTVTIHLSEDEGHTRARAVLHTDAGDIEDNAGTANHVTL